MRHNITTVSSFDDSIGLKFLLRDQSVNVPPAKQRTHKPNRHPCPYKTDDANPSTCRRPIYKLVCLSFGNGQPRGNVGLFTVVFSQRFFTTLCFSHCFLLLGKGFVLIIALLVSQFSALNVKNFVNASRLVVPLCFWQVCKQGRIQIINPRQRAKSC